jgi:5-methylcytosine-specific restriction endonuclease McrA
MKRRVNAYQREFNKVRPSILERDQLTCTAQFSACTERATVVHHIKLRSQDGKNEPDNLKSLCNSCHQYIHANVHWAIIAGWLDEIGPVNRKYSWEEM